MPVLLTFALFLFANVAWAQYRGGTPVYDAQTFTNSSAGMKPFISSDLSYDNQSITLKSYMYTGFGNVDPDFVKDSSLWPVDNFTTVYLQVVDALGNVLLDTYAAGYTYEGLGINSGQSSATFSTGSSASGYAYRYRITGLSQSSTSQGYTLYYDARWKYIYN